jgi:aminoglycoside phosphotransferase (APT) family kinase protein
MPAPESEVEITPELVSRLVSEQFPELAGAATLVAHGWDSDIYRLGDRLAVRLPRRADGVPLVVNEQRWLVELAPNLPVPVPAAVAVGKPAPGYPWPWTIVPWYDGEPADRVTAAARDSIATELALALTALHRPAAEGAPVNAYRGGPLGLRDSRVRDQLARIGPSGEAGRCVWADAVAAPPYDVRLWTHGDLHPGNVLLHPDGRLAALIDFGDMSGGDPAVDLAAAWLFFTPSGRTVFRKTVDRHGDYDAEVWRRARGWAVAFSIGLIAESDGSERMTSLGRAGLAAVTSTEAD